MSGVWDAVIRVLGVCLCMCDFTAHEARVLWLIA